MEYVDKSSVRNTQLVHIMGYLINLKVLYKNLVQRMYKSHRKAQKMESTIATVAKMCITHITSVTSISVYDG